MNPRQQQKLAALLGGLTLAACGSQLDLATARALEPDPTFTGQDVSEPETSGADAGIDTDDAVSGETLVAPAECTNDCAGVFDEVPMCWIATANPLANCECQLENAPPLTPCNDDNKCTQIDACVKGNCNGLEEIECSPVQGACLEAVACEPASGACVANPLDDGSACDDGDVCTTIDSCAQGACVGASPVVCDASGPCVTSACGLTGACEETNLADGLGCDDGDACSMSDACSSGACVGGAIDLCDDSDACTQDTCGAADGCLHSAVSCDDGSACTDDSCDVALGCVNALVDCDDADGCTTDLCDPATGCSNVVAGCDDGNLCTIDTCDGAGGCLNTAVACTDGDACTTGSCDPASGCSFTVVDCADSDACTDDSCDSTIGCENKPTDCSDSDDCTVESCDAAIGCEVLVVDCDDGDLCTDEVCDGAGGCLSTPTVCADSDPCTDDRCVPATGCQFDPADCDDADPCTNDSCDAVAGCQNAAIANCGGVCVGFPDGTPCKVDPLTCEESHCINEVCTGGFGVNDVVALDTSFGDQGRATFYVPGCDYDSKAATGAVQTDGKIVLGGQYYRDTIGRTISMVRMNADGTLDTTFGGGDGYVNDVLNTPSRITDMEVLADGRIVAVGEVSWDMTVWRFNSDGSFDTSFGVGGAAQEPSSSASYFSRDNLVVEPDGSYLVAGWGGFDFRVVKFDSDGNLDPTYGVGGIAQADISAGGVDEAYSMARAEDGSVVLVGIADNEVGVARFLPDGTLDAGFGTAGILQFDVTGTAEPDIGRGLAIDDQGRIIMVGCGNCGFNFLGDAGWMLARLLPDGSFDTSFGGGTGVVYDPMPSTLVPSTGLHDRGRDVLILPSGQYLVAGRLQWNDWAGRMALARYNEDGTLDTCFDGDGYYVQQTWPNTAQSDEASELIMDSDGTILLIGTINPSAWGYKAVARILP